MHALTQLARKLLRRSYLPTDRHARVRYRRAVVRPRGRYMDATREMAGLPPRSPLGRWEALLEKRGSFHEGCTRVRADRDDTAYEPLRFVTS